MSDVMVRFLDGQRHQVLRPNKDEYDVLPGGAFPMSEEEATSRTDVEILLNEAVEGLDLNRGATGTPSEAPPKES